MIVEVTPKSSSGAIFNIGGAVMGVTFRNVAVIVDVPFAPGASLDLTCGTSCLSVPLDEKHCYINPAVIVAEDDLKMIINANGSSQGRALVCFESEVM